MSLLKRMAIVFLCLITLTKAIRPCPQDKDVPAPPPSPLNNEQLASFVSWISESAPPTGCPAQKCAIVLTDFLFANGKTSQFGMQLADTLSSQLSSSAAPVHSIDRSALRNLLERDRVPAQLEGDVGVARWLGKQLNADLVVLGDLSVERDKAIAVTARLVRPNDGNDIPQILRGRIDVVSDSRLDFTPTDALPPLAPLPDNLDGQKVYRAGVDGVGLPMCFHMPNPPVTQDAKLFRFVGNVVVETVLDTSGKIRLSQILAGAPYGLNEITLKTMENWGCRPGMPNGNPVPTLVTFQIHLQPN